MIRGDAIADLEHNFSLKLILQRGKTFQRNNIRTSHDLGARVPLLLRKDKVPAAVRYACRERNPGRGFSPCHGIGKTPRQSALGRNRRTRQIYLGIPGPAPPFKIPVERAYGNTAAYGRTAHANARSARTFQYARAGVQQTHERTILRQHAEHLTRTRGYAAVSRGIYPAPLENISEKTQIGVG